MTDPAPRFYLENVVILSGWPAHAFARLLARHRDEIADLPPHLREPLEDAVAALALAGSRWAARGTAEPLPAELPIGSETHDELDTTEVATMLEVCPRYVRRLAAYGRLPGRKSHGRWRFSRGVAVELHNQRERQA